MPTVSLDSVATWLASYRYTFTCERELQDGLSRALDEGGFSHKREHRLAPGDIVDFLVAPGIGLECKTAFSLSEVTRQLHRYSQHKAIGALLLVTSKSRHDNLPGEMNGKPVQVMVIRSGLA
jgi:hypothetical protein